MRVAVLGAGYAGLTVARRLERTLPESVELVVVDESRSHLVQHELHRVVRRPDLAETITVPLDAVLERATVRRASVTDVDPERGVARLSTAADEPETLTYDVGVVCLGAETAFHDLPGVETHATPLKRLEHARAIRRDVLASEGGTALVGGAGLSGVQLAGELAALSRATDLDLEVRLVEMADRVAPGFDPVFADALRRELDDRGVTVATDVAVDRADAEAVHTADRRAIPYDAFVWTGGIRGPAALRGERLPVDADLQVSDSTFVVGDAGAVVDEGGRDVPASARTAVGEAQVAAKNVVRLVNESTVTDESPGAQPRRYAYEFGDPAWVVSIGDGAIAQVGSVVLGGDPARTMKAVVGAGHLGSVGEIRQASRLVRRELGWPAPDDAGLPFDPETLSDEVDPAALEAIQDSLLGAAVALSRRASPDETVDLTGMTRLGDRSHPDSPANALGRVVSNSIDAARAFNRRRSDGEGDEG